MKRMLICSGVTSIVFEGVKLHQGTKITAAIAPLYIHHQHWQYCFNGTLTAPEGERYDLQKMKDIHSKLCEKEILGERVF